MQLTNTVIKKNDSGNVGKTFRRYKIFLLFYSVHDNSNNRSNSGMNNDFLQWIAIENRHQLKNLIGRFAAQTGFNGQTVGYGGQCLIKKNISKRAVHPSKIVTICYKLFQAILSSIQRIYYAGRSLMSYLAIPMGMQKIYRYSITILIIYGLRHFMI